jgi:hypothetical protein
MTRLTVHPESCSVAVARPRLDRFGQARYCLGDGRPWWTQPPEQLQAAATRRGSTVDAELCQGCRARLARLRDEGRWPA